MAVALALLSGCATPQPDEGPLLVRGSAEVAGAGPAWCYSTLADADCHIQRDFGATDRLIGGYVPAQPYGAENP